ncbi:hypothetical protein CSUI_005307 [Cystoisospora suis]|uniref:Uncharacterized protein n=1 Tax=Cystoisospora suis TaxID=483139 RepID=A0A2C6KXI4_9APIC|nr:hypothetical protein CSUI_005307 [Cystoisospora suis]
MTESYELLTTEPIFEQVSRELLISHVGPKMWILSPSSRHLGQRTQLSAALQLHAGAPENAVWFAVGSEGQATVEGNYPRLDWSPSGFSWIVSRGPEEFPYR